jgi:hypothetical protein
MRHAARGRRTGRVEGDGRGKVIYEPDDMLTPTQAAAIIGRSAEFIRSLCSAGLLAHVPSGAGRQRQHVKIRYQSLCEWRESQERASIAQTWAAVRASARSSAPRLPHPSRYSAAGQAAAAGRAPSPSQAA